MAIALLIDPTEKLATQVETDGSFDSMYALVGCDMLERAIPLPEADHLVMWIDEEGRLKKDQKCFFLGRHLVAGKALIVAYAENPQMDDAKLMDIELLEALALTEMIVGCPDDYDYTPPPPVIISWDPSKTN